MKKNGSIYLRRIHIDPKTQYPLWSMLLVLLLILLAPFTARWTNYLALAVCAYRIFRYDARIFAVDYCVLIPFIVLFRNQSDMSLFIYVCLFAAACYFVKGGIRKDSAYLILIIILNYLILRMDMDLARMALCFSQLVLACVLLPGQDGVSAERAAKGFCLSVILSSVYALIFRGSGMLNEFLGAEVPAIWGTSIMRFQGLFEDPNYYMTTLVVGIALLIKLNDCKRIPLWSFIVGCLAMIVFGVLSYSKAFAVLLVLLAMLFVFWQFRNRKYLRGVLLVVLGVLALTMILSGGDSALSTLLERFTSAKSLSDLTTGRTELLQAYMKEITSTAGGFLFGQGMTAAGLYLDPHNLFVEIWYYLGIVGLFLFVGLYIAIFNKMKQLQPWIRKQNFFAKYVALLVILVAYFSLHGMYEAMCYGEIFLALLSVLILPKDSVPTEEQTEEAPRSAVRSYRRTV